MIAEERISVPHPKKLVLAKAYQAVSLHIVPSPPKPQQRIIVTQADTFGLIQLHCPDHPTVDVCFVHGVGGGNISTWSLKNFCWPRDLLPEDIPNARILSFGYDAKIV